MNEIIPVEEKKAEALQRIAQLVNSLGLNPNVEGYFREGKLYYSYLTAGGFMGSIDNIEYDERFPKVVAEFEESYDFLVYHVLETGSSLSLLFVGNHKEDWPTETLFNDKYIQAYVYNFDIPEYSEFGDIALSSLQGALIRVG
jgi:hypothetical protein